MHAGRVLDGGQWRRMLKNLDQRPNDHHSLYRTRILGGRTLDDDNNNNNVGVRNSLVT